MVGDVDMVGIEVRAVMIIGRMVVKKENGDKANRGLWDEKGVAKD